MSSPLVAVALTLDERDLAVAALRELATRSRRVDPEREQAEEVAALLASALPVDDVTVRIALLDEVDE